MKTTIHPQYYPEAKIKCACGKSWISGATMPEISVEICNNCHPFYTGKGKVLDKRGRIDKLNKRKAKSQEMMASAKVKKPRVKKSNK